MESGFKLCDDAKVGATLADQRTKHTVPPMLNFPDLCILPGNSLSL
jgi:hypothetical protein